MNEILMIASGGLWLCSAAAINGDNVPGGAVLFFLMLAIVGSVITYNII